LSENGLAKVDECGLGEPPHIDEIFQSFLEAKKQFPAKNKEDAERIFDGLRQKWKALIS